MPYAASAMVAIIAAAAFCWQIVLRSRRGRWVPDFVSVSLMVGFTGVGLLYLGLAPDLSTTVPLVWYYVPHAYNLVIWPLSAILVLRPRFGPAKFLLAFTFVYSLDELLWNSIAYVHFGGGGQVLSFMLTPYWTSFLVTIVSALLVSYYFLRPRIIPNWTWIFFIVFVFVYAVLAGLPTIIDEPASAYSVVFTWELMWQGAVWLFVYGTFWAREEVGLATRGALI